MPTENTTQQRLMEARSRALATLFLTRRAGTVFQDLSKDDLGLDMCVTLVSERKAGLRQLGVELKWQFEPVTAEQGNDWLAAQWKKLTTSGPFPFPVVVFFFTMRDDGAWYSWVAEPTADEGKAKLSLHDEPDCQLLTDEALDELLDRVDEWYDARYAGFASAVSGKRAKKS